MTRQRSNVVQMPIVWHVPANIGDRRAAIEALVSTTPEVAIVNEGQYPIKLPEDVQRAVRDGVLLPRGIDPLGVRTTKDVPCADKLRYIDLRSGMTVIVEFHTYQDPTDPDAPRLTFFKVVEAFLEGRALNVNSGDPTDQASDASEVGAFMAQYGFETMRIDVAKHIFVVRSARRRQ